MKKKLFLFIFTLTSLQGFTQITLEHEYQGNTVLIKTGSDEFYYWNNNPSDTTLRIYNVDHSIHKTIEITEIPAGYQIINYNDQVSKVLFNTDATDFEFIGFLKPIGGGFDFIAVVYNEDGTILSELGHGSYSEILNAGTNGAKLLLISGDDDSTKIFSLPGTIFSGIYADGSIEEEKLMPAYPNPTADRITLPFQLPVGQEYGQLKVYNNLGHLVKSYQVDGQFNTILFDTAPYPAGQYHYSLQAGGHQSRANNFVIVK